MRLAVPANYDAAILPELARLGATEVYGKLPLDEVGGGRPTYMASPLPRRALARYVGAVRAAGMEFNYLLNAACTGNREWTGGFQRRLRRLLDWICEIGAGTVTVVAPLLLQIVKRSYPQLKVKVGIYAQVDTALRARWWEEQGADAINLESFSINREFEKLARIRAAVRCELPLIANHFCQPNCPFQLQHQNGHAHASGADRRFLVDYPLLQCHRRRLDDPSLLISAGWIRPEDAHVYEEMGFHSFKLIERNIPSDVLLQRVRAYAGRRFDGNLAELLFSWGFRSHPPRWSWLHFLRSFGPWRMHPRSYRLVLSLLREQGFFFTQERAPVVIDTRAIPGDFVQHFRRRSCLDADCRSCGYCGSIARAAVRIDPDFLARVRPLYDKVEDLLVGGGMWGIEDRSRFGTIL